MPSAGNIAAVFNALTVTVINEGGGAVRIGLRPMHSVNVTMPHSSISNSEQQKRTGKALAGLANGSLKVEQAGPDTWHVQNGDQAPYLVVRASARWACECSDWTGRCRTAGLNCKHIEAVRLSPQPSQQQTLTNSIQMKENHMEQTQQPNNILCAWTRLFHPSGVQVTVPLPLDSVLPVEACKAMLQSVTALLEAGWQANLSSLEDGERMEEIRHVVRRVKNNDDGSETPVIDLYPERANFRILGMYLNTPADVQTFESVCRVRLSELPLYEGDNAIERGKGPKTDKYVTTLPSPVKVVLKQNPRWQGEEDKKHPKRLFVRWLNVPGSGDTGSGDPPPSQPSSSPRPAPTKSGNGRGANGHNSNSQTDSTASTDKAITPAKLQPSPEEIAKARAMAMTMGSDAVKGKPLGDLGRDVWDFLATSQFKGEEALALQRAAQLLLAVGS